MQFSIIPKGFPHAEVNVPKAADKTPDSYGSVKNTLENMDDKNTLKLVEELAKVLKDKTLEPINTEPMMFKMNEDYAPKALTVPRKIPYVRHVDEIKKFRKLEAGWIWEKV